MMVVVYSALAMTLIVALRYVMVSGLFAWLTSRVRPGHYAGLGRQIRMELGWSLVSCAIYGVPAGIIAWGWQSRGWTLIYSDPKAWPCGGCRFRWWFILWRMIPGFTGRTAGCTARRCSGAFMPFIMPAARRRPGQR